MNNFLTIMIIWLGVAWIEGAIIALANRERSKPYFKDYQVTILLAAWPLFVFAALAVTPYLILTIFLKPKGDKK